MIRMLAGSAAALLAPMSCTRAQPEAPPTVVVDSAGISLVSNDIERNAATCAIGSEPSLTIGQAEGPEEYQLYRVFGAAKLSDGRIALINQGSQQIRYYDVAGRFLSASGRRGSGPGEFQNAFYLWALPGDTVWVGDYRPWQFQVFGPGGEWVRTVRPEPAYANPPSGMVVLDDGRSVLLARSGAPAPTGQPAPARLSAVVHAADGSPIDTLATFPLAPSTPVPNSPINLFLSPLFTGFPRVTGAGSRVLVAHTDHAEVRAYEADDAIRLTMVVRWTEGDRRVSAADVQAERRRIAASFAGADEATRRNILDPQISESRPVAERFPAFNDIAAGRDGRVWVQEQPRRGDVDSPHRTWIAYDASGRFFCRAQLPVFANVFEFGRDYLLVLHRDALGVERVLQYDLVSPAP